MSSTISIRKACISPPTCILLVLVCAFMSSRIEAVQKGTTQHIREIFLGRCYDFQETQTVDREITKKKCLNMYVVFTQAVKGHSGCTKNISGIFDNFFKLANPGSTRVNKVNCN